MSGYCGIPITPANCPNRVTQAAMEEMPPAMSIRAFMENLGFWLFLMAVCISVRHSNISADLFAPTYLPWILRPLGPTLIWRPSGCLRSW